jgi:hypothetical protein
MEDSTGLRLIGRRERVCFPEWGLRRVRAKIDTGAYSSALDVREYELFEAESRSMVRIQLLLNRRHPQRVAIVETPVAGMIFVRNSSGKRESRPLIEPLVQLGPVIWRIRLTITNREPMRCPMLLGRHALAGRFLVDVGGKDLLQG